MAETMRVRPDRRGFLRGLLTAGGAAVALGGVAGLGAAQESANVVLDGFTGGWVGRYPSAIADEENPTLTLRAGETYVLVWENMDGVPHNVVIEDAEGNNIVKSELVSDEGAIQRVEFEATEAMVHYYCQVHPGSMSGEVEVVPAGSGEGISSDETTTVTPSSTPTPTPTETPTATEEPTATETTAPPETTTEAAAETTASDGQPGFGALAGLAGVAAYATARVRRR